MRRFPVLAVVALALASCSSGDGSNGDGAVAVGDTPSSTTPADVAGASELAADVPPESADASGDVPQEEPVDQVVTIDDSCDALAESEISEVTGLQFAPGAPSTVADADFQDACDWVSVDGLTTAQLIIVNADVFGMNRTSADEVSDVEAVEVAGTDEAYATFGGSIVGMRYGKQFVQFAVIGSDGVDRSQAVLDLAALAVSRL